MPFDLPHMSGGNVGGIHIVQMREHETTAYAQNAKMLLGILPDSIGKVLTELSPRFNFGYLGGFGYQGTPARHVLDHPLESVRIMQGFLPPSSSNWEATYQELVSMLPPKLAAALQFEMHLPLNLRDPSFTALNNLLTVAAQVYTAVEAAAQPNAPDSIEAGAAAINLLFPFMAFQGALGNSIEMAAAVTTLLALEGANFPGFDGLNNVLGGMEKAIVLMQLVNQGLNDTPGGQLNPLTRDAAIMAASIVSDLVEQTNNVSLGNNFQIIPATLAAMEAVLIAIALPDPAMGSLYLGLTTAMIGLSTEDSPLGILGPAGALVLDAVTTAIAAGILPENEWPGAQLLATVTAASLLILIGLSTLAMDPGYGPLAMADPSANAFAFEIALGFLANTRALEAFYSEMIAASGGDAQAQATGSAILADVAYLSIILGGSTTGNRPPEALIEAESALLLIGLEAALEISSLLDTEMGVATTIALNQIVVALENNDYSGATGALNSLLESLGVSPEALQKDFTSLEILAEALVAALTNNPNDQITGMMEVV